MITSKENAEHHIWGNNCDSWVLLNFKNLSVKQEIMPPKTKEQLHFHKNAQQFFFILKGKAKFHKKGNIFEVSENSGVHILPNQIHLIENDTENDLEFLVISNPSTNNDKFAVEK